MPNSQHAYKRIGLFDSGVGGLSVLRQLANAAPHADFVYVGDTARLPYGNRSQGEIALFVQEIVGFLAAYQLDVVVMACNTSAALAKDVAVKCAAGQNFQVFDLIEPTAAHIAQMQISSVGILATNATAQSHAFARALEAAQFTGSVIEVGCPKLVPLIESGRLGEESVEVALEEALGEYLAPMAGVSAIVLGCTHFPFIADRVARLVSGPLKALFPNAVTILDPAVILLGLFAFENLDVAQIDFAPHVVNDADEAKSARALRQEKLEILISGSASEFARTAAVCLGHEVTNVRQVQFSAGLLTAANSTALV